MNLMRVECEGGEAGTALPGSASGGVCGPVQKSERVDSLRTDLETQLGSTQMMVTRFEALFFLPRGRE